MRIIILTIIILMSLSASAQTTKPVVEKLIDQPDAWFIGEGKSLVENVLTWQNKNGGWWKAYDVEKANSAAVDEAGVKKNGSDSGFDNGATYSEMRIVARAYRVTQNARYKKAFDRGLKFMLDAQYPNGGWPQRLPLKKTCSPQIAFNADAMVNLMPPLQDIVQKKPDFTFVSDDDRTRCKEAFDK